MSSDGGRTMLPRLTADYVITGGSPAPPSRGDRPADAVMERETRQACQRGTGSEMTGLCYVELHFRLDRADV
jgi:hypothetical protein